MGVPGETTDQRRRALTRRPIAAGVAIGAFALLAYLYVPLPAPNVAAPSAGDCVELTLFTNGFHTDIAAPAAIFPEAHPLRRLYPDAQTFLIGWGEERFYFSDGTDVWLGLNALIPPSPSVMHITYNAPAVAAYLGPNAETPVAVSTEGAASFVAFVDRALVLDEAGEVVRTSDGKIVGRSSFLRTRGSFHLFNVCNQWMARALRAAGINLNARAAWLGGPLVRAVEETGRTSCAALQRPR